MQKQERRPAACGDKMDRRARSLGGLFLEPRKKFRCSGARLGLRRKEICTAERTLRRKNAANAQGRGLLEEISTRTLSHGFLLVSLPNYTCACADARQDYREDAWVTVLL